MKAVVYNQKAEKIGEVELNSKIFELKASHHLLAEAARIQLSSARKGLANTKTRGEVSGGGKKPWKQKGTGRARAGSTRGPIWRHGGVAFGPRSNRNWELKINKKAKTKALFMSLSDKATSGAIVVVDAIILEGAKTKNFVAMLGGFKKEITGFGKKQLFILPKQDDVLVRASRNIPSVKPYLASNLNLVDVMNADTLFVLKDSLPIIEKTFLSAKPTTK